MSKPQRRMVRVSATELEDADVKRISLVGRGANRIPFRIMKSEDSKMGISLSGLFTRQKSDTSNTKVAAIAVAKNDRTESLVAQIKEQFGEPVEIDEGQDDALILKYEGFDEESATVIKMTDDIAAVIGGVEKAFQPFNGSSKFTENVQSMNFLPGLRLGMDALTETVFSIMSKAETKDEMEADVTNAVSEFGGFVNSMVGQIPTTAFKLEGIFAVKEEATSDPDKDGIKDTEKKFGGKMPGGKSNDMMDEDDKGKKGKKRKEDVSDDDDSEGEEAKKQDDTDDDRLATAIHKAFTQMNQKMDENVQQLMAGMMSQLDERLETVQKTADDEKGELQKKLDDALNRVQKMEEDVSGTVVGGSHLSDESMGNRQQVHKDEDSDRPGLFDDAFELPGWESK